MTPVGPPVVDAQARADLFLLASLLLQYPDAELVAVAPGLVDRARALPGEVGEGVVRLAELLAGSAALESQARYVETFDLRRRTSLDLTYYLHGDTRRRGLALLTLKQRYRAAGFTVTDRVLPDFLPLVLEFAAVAGPARGEAPLRQHRPGLAVLADALRESGSPYAAVVDAVCAVLPEMTDADHAAVATLAADGPLDELVGLEHPSLHPPAVQEACS